MDNNAIRTTLVAELLPGIQPWQVMLIHTSGGWFADLSPRFHRKRARWRYSSFHISAGSRGWDGSSDCVYKTARKAIEALRDELERLHGNIGKILACTEVL